ncbi:hypothetical protein [Lederbergia lenta]|uniref:hypothetical protein n=1 Tax=Lederbergia lenta TaxID=1467 RepID=UPI0020425E4E|nr:hypothetical protein [Lederbergia lenta]MCM3113620.1 hypothetical protein [Lederbergia lenta]
MENTSIQLYTYGTVLNKERENEISFQVPIEWLVRNIKLLFENNLENFLENYTWDSSESLFFLAKKEGVLLDIKQI